MSSTQIYGGNDAAYNGAGDDGVAVCDGMRKLEYPAAARVNSVYRFTT